MAPGQSPSVGPSGAPRATRARNTPKEHGVKTQSGFFGGGGIRKRREVAAASACTVDLDVPTMPKFLHPAEEVW